MYDKRKPKIEKLGCFCSSTGFIYFNKKTMVKDNDVLIYNKGILWRLKQ